MQVGEAWKDEGCGVVPAIALSPDGKKVATGSGDGAVRLWDIDMGKVVKKIHRTYRSSLVCELET
jgi:WD40 repeat protein